MLKVHSIELVGSESAIALASMLFTSKSYSDTLFESIYFKTNMTLDKPSQLLFRLYYEMNILYRDSEYIITKPSNDLRCDVYISLKEAFLFIQKVFPPNMKNLLDQVNSVHDVLSMMRFFLMDESNGNIGYYLSSLEQYLYMIYDEHEPMIDKRIGLIRSYNPYDDTIIVVDKSIIPIDEILVHTDYPGHEYTKLILQTHTKAGIFQIYDMITHNDTFQIDRVDFDKYQGIIVYGWLATFTKQILLRIRKCYSFLKK